LRRARIEAGDLVRRIRTEIRWSAAATGGQTLSALRDQSSKT
jgi:hypothetical protein